ncbi:MAG: site-2 protease family protein [Verrucomicrobia bacterium]|jgi:Zn-dependent protease|nr:site-2 protease family protein [Verrucomicrobiota bacterium]
MDFGITPADLRAGLIFYLLLFSCLVLRAYSQAWLADRLGDPTPRDEGRVTLYPLPHLDLLGSVILPLICIFFLQPRLGQINFFLAWTNPVPINPANFKNPQRHYLFTQLGSCGMSVVLALLSAVVGGISFHYDQRFAEIFGTLIGINAMLIVLDMLPVPPLPGAMLLRHWGFMSEERFWQVARWSGLVFMIAINIPPIRTALGILIALVALPFGWLFEVIAR